MTEIFNHGYALLIGVGESAYKPLSLPVTVKDTQAIHAVLIDPELCAYPDNEQHIRVLNNAEATYSNILDGLKWLKEKAESDSEATIFIYYSGHGWVNRNNNRYYLLQHDVKPSQLASSALSAETFTDALRQIHAKRLLVVMDSCHAAGMATSKDADAIAKADAELFEEFDDFKRLAPSKGLIEALTKGEGRAVFTSSEREEKSWIKQDSSLSIYTYHFLEALQGAGNKVGDTEVKLSDLMGHLSDTVSKTALKECNAQQTPYFDLGGNNFAIALLRGGKGLSNNGRNVYPQFRSLIADKTEGFVGREYIFDGIEAFIANNPKGYFTLIGDPGQGKSAILAKYVQDTGCIAHFNLLLQGPNRADQFLESVCRQLIERYELSYDPLPPNATRDGEFLGQLLDEVAQQRKGEKVIIAVDGLDEVDTNSYRDPANILYLPAHLPDRVYFILTRRRDVDVPLSSFAPMQTISLLDYKTDSERDVITYIGNRINSSQNLRQGVDVIEESITEFTNKIAEKSENNFMYLRYVLIDIEKGLYQDLTLEQFPQGLEQYYQSHWRRMGMTAEPLPVDKIKIVYILGEVREPVSRRKICDVSAEDEYAVQQVLNEWKQFLHEFMTEEKRYTVYHASFRDFLHRQDILDKHPVTIPGIHQLIANNELKVWDKMKEFLKRNRRGE